MTRTLTRFIPPTPLTYSLYPTADSLFTHSSLAFHLLLTLFTGSSLALHSLFTRNINLGFGAFTASSMHRHRITNAPPQHFPRFQRSHCASSLCIITVHHHCAPSLCITTASSQHYPMCWRFYCIITALPPHHHSTTHFTQLLIRSSLTSHSLFTCSSLALTGSSLALHSLFTRSSPGTLT
jgi:hypothetical protein